MSTPPENERTDRRLSAVLHADVTDFSKRMGEDGPATIDAVNRLWRLFTNTVPRHGGTLDVFKGDCFLALFPTAVGAVRAAVDIQTYLAAGDDQPGECLRIRIGIHLGEVVCTEGGQFFGDSINIAARVQSIAKPGSVGVSDDVYRAVRSQMKEVEFRDEGLKSLKNIRDPVRVWDVRLSYASETPGSVRPLSGSAAAPAWHSRRWAAALVGVLLTIGLGLAYYGRPALQPYPHPPSLVVGVMNVRPRQPDPAPMWMCDITREALNTIFSKVPGLRVYPKEKFDFLRETRGLSEIEAAEALGINKMVSGTLSMAESVVMLDLRLVDAHRDSVPDATDDVAGNEDQLVELQNAVAQLALARLNIPLNSAEKTQIFERRTNETLESYKRLHEVLGVFIEETGDAAVEPKPAVGLSRAAAHLHGTSPEEAAIRRLLEQYRMAFQIKDSEMLAALSVAMTDAQRSALERYFDGVLRLSVDFSNVDLLIERNQALATFTRRDVFRDARTGRGVELEVRTSNLLAKLEGGWKIKGLKTPS